jgi:hypothetical protein
MLKTAAIVTLSIPLVLVGAVLGSGVVVVDVRQADGPRIIVPVPVSLARTALAFAPDEAKYVEVPELAEYSDIAEQVIDELAGAPDGVLVEVHDHGDHVWIAKVGDEIEIEIDTDDEDVSVKVPLELVADILDSYDGDELDTREALSALSTVSRTDLVHVRTEEEEVKIWVW